MNGLALCAGVGGLEAGISVALPGYRTVCYVEWEAYAAATLVARMADPAAIIHPAPVWNDVKTFRGVRWRGVVDIITAGYPCQPFSRAGKRKGERDPRHLWPDIKRIIGEVRPCAVFLENVEGHLSLGFPEVAAGLQGMGYSVKAILVAADEAGAGQQRSRLFALAYSKDFARILHARSRRSVKRETDTGRIGQKKEMASTSGPRLEGGEQQGTYGERRAGASGSASELCRPLLFAPGPDDDRWPAIIEQAPQLEPAICRMADGMAHRVDRLRLCGNGVVSLAGAYAFATLAHAATGFEITDFQSGAIEPYLMAGE